MTSYLARRVLQAVAVVFGVTLIVFTLLWLAPGGAATAVLGSGSAHQQFVLQYLTWLGRALHGNLGFAPKLNETVGSVLAASLPRTLALTVTSTLLALVVAIPVGLIQAVRRNSATDHALRGLTLLFYGMPSFVLGPLLVMFLADRWHRFGAEGPQAPGFIAVITDVRDLTLPVLTLALVTIAIFARYMRSSAADSLAEEYVEAARARGASQRRVLTRHVLRNSLVPVVTLIGLSFPQIVGGAVVVENVFNIHGVGWQVWQAAANRDFPVTLGFALVIAVAAVVGSLLADICYALLDPRVRYQQA
ncbi:MAG TPA: ABC transporter permease [Streptosporangiaceae bacterium]